MDKPLNMFDALMKLEKLSKDIMDSIIHWIDIRDNGCHDPTWCDGTNMNLVHNHILYYKSQIKEICDQFYIQVPPEYNLPDPPLVDNDWMADLNCERAVRFSKEPFQNPIHYEVEYDPYK